MLDDALFDRFRRGDRLALSRLISLLARGEHLGAIQDRLSPAQRPSLVVAVTGGGGVGKSTFVGRLIEWLRGRGQTVAVLACDPQSPVSAGALLGDRFRMPSRPDDDGVFIRSLAAASGHGAVARHLGPMVRLLETFGFDVILLETVGAGQGDTAVRDLADVIVLLLQPETGDELQWEKAGILEVADVVIVHKADLPGADRVEAQVRSALEMAGGRPVPIVRVSSKTGSGMDAVWPVVLERRRRRHADRPGADDLIRAAQEVLAARYARAEAASDPALGRVIARWREGTLDRDEAAELLLRRLAGGDELT